MSKLLTVTTRVLNLAAHLHAKAIGAHRRSLTARAARCMQIRTAAYEHFLEARAAHENAIKARAAFDESLAQPIVVETSIKA